MAFSILCWYDNEAGYATRLVQMAQYIGSQACRSRSPGASGNRRARRKRLNAQPILGWPRWLRDSGGLVGELASGSGSGWAFGTVAMNQVSAPTMLAPSISAPTRRA